MNGTGNIEVISAETVPASFVYMLYSHGLVKIGFTSDPTTRFDRIRNVSAAPVSLIWLAHGTKAIERKLHQGFSDDRKNGEWFHPSDAIRRFLASRPSVAGMPPLKRLEWAEANPDKMLGP
jgi:hypothetical protein